MVALLRGIASVALVLAVLTTTQRAVQAGHPAVKKAVAEGRRLYDAGKFVEAAERYREAYSGSKNPRYLLGEAMSLEGADTLPDAIRVFEQYLDVAPRGKHADKVRERLAALRERLGRTHAELHVESEPPGAEVTVEGGVILGVAPVDAWVPYGSRLHGRLAGCSEAEPGGVEVRRNGDTQVVLRLLRDGRLRLDCRAAGALITVDGKEQGRGPLDTVLHVRAGEHRVRVAEGEVVLVDESVQVAEGAERTVVIEERPPDPPPPPPPPLPEAGFSIPTGAWIAGGAAIAAAAVGVGFGASALSAGEEADAYSVEPGADPARWDDLSSKAETHGLASSISLGVAGAAALTAGVLILVDNLSGDDAAPIVTAPMAAADGAGWMIQVHY